MTRLIVGLMVVGACALAYAAPTVLSATTTRLGGPLADLDPQLTVSDAVGNGQDPAQRTSPPGDPVLDVSLPKQLYNAGEPVVLTTHLHGAAGDIDGAVITVEDAHGLSGDTRAHYPDTVRHGQAVGQGRHTTQLDTTPGEHVITVSADAVVNGNSVHRSTTHAYTVADGHVKVIDVGTPYVTTDDVLHVPLKLVCTAGTAWVKVSAVLASGPTAVARADVSANVQAGAAVVDLPYRHADLVEPGPYRIVRVVVEDSDERMGPQLAAAADAVGQPFNVALAPTGREPADLAPNYGRGPRAPLVLPTPWGQGAGGPPTPHLLDADHGAP